MERHVVAMGGGGFSMDDPVLDRYVLDLTGASRPKVCFLPTASGDAAGYQEAFLAAFPPTAFAPSVLRLFEREVADVAALLGEQDVVYVGGGNTAIMLAAWRLHGVDAALRAAWEAGVVMAGLSAGANCWFEASTTDSFLLGRADPLRDGLGFLAGSFTPHYDGEAARRPSLHTLVATGALPPGLACDDFAAVRFSGTEMVEAVASRPGASCYRVVRTAGGDAEEAPVSTPCLG
jgi:peptidase E